MGRDSKMGKWSFKQRETKTVRDGDEYFTIQKLNQGDRDDIMDVLSSMEVAEKTEKQLAKMNLGTMKALQRERSLVDWHILDEKGNPVELNPVNLRNMPQALANAIDDAIDELNPEELTDAKKKQ